LIQQLELSNNYSSGLQNQIDSLIALQENSTLVGYNDIALDMPFGWSMFGYTCISPIDVMDAFIQISDKVIILKDEFGNAYLPQYSFNGVGELQFAKGYQIKLNEIVDNFQFCPTIINLEE
jgi:hypothetical protein